MKTYRYRGFDPRGNPVEGTVRALNETDAAEKIRAECPIPVRLTAVPDFDLQALLHTDVAQLLSGGRFPAKKLALLCSQLSIGLRAGLPLVRCLALTAQNQTDPAIRQLLEAVAEDVRAGHSLAESFEAQSTPLPAVFVHTVQAGEQSASLADAFFRLSDYYSRQAAVASAVGSAMLYPAMLMLAAIGVIVIIMVYAVPVFEASFSRMADSLPLATTVLIRISRFLSQNAFILTALLVCGVLAAIGFSRTSRGQQCIAKILLSLPVVGPVNRMHGAAQLSSTLSSMLTAGLTLPEALEVTADTMENPLLSQALRHAGQGIREGRSLSEGLAESTFFPGLLQELTAVGEETGTLAQTLTLAADYYRSEVETAVKRALGLLEPVIILLLAALVVWILLAVYLPMFQMYSIS